MVSFSASVRTDRGLVRDHNEDSVLQTDRLVAVADGLGGHAAGELASRLAVEHLSVLGNRPDATPDDLLAAIRAANRAIFAAGESDPEAAGLGTTLCGVALVVLDGVEQCAAFNVGDSRVYGFGDSQLTQISVDHSEVQELQDAGLLDPDEAMRYPRRNIVTRWLGSDIDPVPDVWVFAPVVGARFLVCSDGLTNEVDDETIADLLGGRQAPAEAVDDLVARALDAGGRDNVSVAVVDVDT
jgi:serine/threonine protein phosphatase PrpC